MGTPSGIHVIDCTGESGFLLMVVMQLLPAEAGPGRSGHQVMGSCRYHPYQLPHSSSISSATCSSSYPPQAAVPDGDRLRPRLAQFSFPEDSVLPRDADRAGRRDGVPLSIYRHSRLRRALGAAPLAPVPRGRLTTPAPSAASPDRRLGQFRGDLRIGTWNAQALFAVDPTRRSQKMQYLQQLMKQVDVLLITEAHGTAGDHALWHAPGGCSGWWSPGPSTGHAGVGVVIRKSFLENFDPNPVKAVIWQGRALKLSLRGSLGALDVVVAYFHTGAALTDMDLYDVRPQEMARCSCFPGLRACLRSRIAGRLSLPRNALTVLGGDFNYVAEEAGRQALSTARASGARDLGEERHFQSVLGSPFSLCEMFQNEPTHASASARSRLDRIYLNQHASEQLDRHMSCCALAWKACLSAHRAVVFSRQAPQRLPPHLRPLPDHALRHEDFERRVLLEYGQRLRDHPNDKGIQKLGHLKAAMRQVGLNLEKEWSGCPAAETLEDRLGATLRFIRAFERGFAGEISNCLHRYPRIRDFVTNPYDFVGNTTTKLQQARAHAIELARDHALDELGKSHADLKGSNELQAARARARNTRLIFRLRPGRFETIHSIMDKNGEQRTAPGDMAEALQQHWGQVFQRRGFDEAKMEEWLAQDAARRPPEQRRPFPANQFRLKKKHIRDAIRSSRSSSPGPDGLPFLAWRRVESLAVEVLHETFGDICSEEGLRRLHEFGEDFNASLLFFIPKGAPERTAEDELYHAVDKVRPLNVTNADNRLMANAVRMVIEDAVARRISKTQRGFLPGRSMLANLVDLDEGLAEHYIAGSESAAFFFDFEAAFPSIEHGFMMRLFKHFGWPDWLLRFVEALYQDNKCEVVIKGTRCTGFRLTRGVRQGCPLSPLLFAVASDLLLFRLERLLPSALVRAYADDLVILVERALAQLPTLHRLFDDYARISGLRLNFRKTVFVPLFPIR